MISSLNVKGMYTNELIFLLQRSDAIEQEP